MPFQSPVFGAADPIELTTSWLDEARETEPNDPNAMALATVDASGMPDVRIVLLKGIDAQGFVFYTNYDSAKGREIAESGTAALVLHWKSLRRQVRVRGRIARASAEESDAYYASRPLDSRLGAWASDQSRPLGDRAELERRVADMRDRFGEDPPRPPHWGGFRITPLQIEFWADGPARLHDREVWRRRDGDTEWSVERLFP